MNLLIQKERNIMINENILSISFAIFMLISGFLVVRIATKLNKSIDKSMENRFRSRTLRSKFFDNEKNLERLVRENDPFNWRVGLALSLAALNEEEEKRFLKALATVLKYENYVVKNKDETKRRPLRQILHPIFPGKPFKEVMRFRDMFTVKRLMDGSTDRETLTYILQLSIDEYEAKKIPPGPFTRTITYIESDDDPFDPESPF